jgi:hypothetical protein
MLWWTGPERQWRAGWLYGEAISAAYQPADGLAIKVPEGQVQSKFQVEEL